MSKILSLKLKNEIFEETESILKKTKHPRNAYFNEAIHFYNRLFTRKMLRKQLLKESAMVAEQAPGFMPGSRGVDFQRPIG
jgi:hypothetical protein